MTLNFTQLSHVPCSDESFHKKITSLLICFQIWKTKYTILEDWKCIEERFCVRLPQKHFPGVPLITTPLPTLFPQLLLSGQVSFRTMLWTSINGTFVNFFFVDFIILGKLVGIKMYRTYLTEKLLLLISTIEVNPYIQSRIFAHSIVFIYEV